MRKRMRMRKMMRQQAMNYQQKAANPLKNRQKVFLASLISRRSLQPVRHPTGLSGPFQLSALLGVIVPMPA
jgi:hypothetical protein